MGVLNFWRRLNRAVLVDPARIAALEADRDEAERHLSAAILDYNDSQRDLADALRLLRQVTSQMHEVGQHYTDFSDCPHPPCKEVRDRFPKDDDGATG